MQPWTMRIHMFAELLHLIAVYFLDGCQVRSYHEWYLRMCVRNGLFLSCMEKARLFGADFYAMAEGVSRPVDLIVSDFEKLLEDNGSPVNGVRIWLYVDECVKGGGCRGFFLRWRLTQLRRALGIS